VLEYAGYFQATNGDVLKDPRATIYVNDGREHLCMQSEQTYDLVTMEPQPLATAGVAGLYSREFYALVRSRLKPGDYLTQWLPAYQMPGDATRAVVRFFVDTFPSAVLLSGARSELILMGTTNPTLTVDPARVAARLEAPAVAVDLLTVDLGTLTELLGTFAASATTLTGATSQAPPVTDDQPLIEHVAHSHLVATRIPPEIFDVSRFAEFCPGCSGYSGLEHLPAYLSVLATVYGNPLFLEQT
jgi:spermidine synthase